MGWIIEKYNDVLHLFETDKVKSAQMLGGKLTKYIHTYPYPFYTTLF